MLKRTMIAVSLLTPGLAAQQQGPEPDEAANFAPVPFAALADGLRYRAVTVDGASHAALVLTVRSGTSDDPPDQVGLARVVATVMRLALSPTPPDEGREVAVRALEAGTTFAMLVERAAVPAALARLRTVFGDPGVLDDDLIARAVAQTRLQIDDDSETLPGPMMFAWARSRLWAGTRLARPAHGVAEDLASLGAQPVRAWIAERFRPAHASLVVVGAIDAVGAADMIARAFESEVAASAPARGSSDDDRSPLLSAVAGIDAPSEAPIETREHRLVDAPFVSAAWRAPRYGEADYLAFLIGMGALRARAARQFTGYRGGEVRAGFEYVNFRFLDAPRIVLVNRRGRDGDPVDRVRAEIDGVFADLRSHGLEDMEIALSMRELVQTVALPPYDAALRDSMTRYPALLHARAYVLAMYELHGWPEQLPELLQKTPVVDVRRVVHTTLQKDSLRWFALLPTPEAANGERPGESGR